MVTLGQHFGLQIFTSNGEITYEQVDKALPHLLIGIRFCQSQTSTSWLKFFLQIILD